MRGRHRCYIGAKANFSHANVSSPIVFAPTNPDSGTQILCYLEFEFPLCRACNEAHRRTLPPSLEIFKKQKARSRQ